MVPTRRSVDEIFSSENSAFSTSFLKESSIFPYNSPGAQGKAWKCCKKLQKRRITIQWDIFLPIHKKINEILEIAYYWVTGPKNKYISKMVGISKPAMAYYANASLDFVDMQIGGKDVVVEIDECKLGKDKHHRQYEVEGAWVLGDVEKTIERRLFLIEVPDRTANTLLQ
ncbi:hypothetical protein RF11_15687 [Thelohanellus kitauei]|uniref:DDE-1 domain-containing protein n=1 Tax=Thelohanellus kitauei TaxID=669202 RepID=A0A0C2MRQ1_THEKT|nr:hypothetical protein RF11_15687 [Thelohanellus kitauei]